MFNFLGCANAKPKIDMQIIAQIESSNGKDIKESSAGAIGVYQITTICLMDYNRVKTRRLIKEDLYNPITNKAIATWYINERIPQFLKYYDLQITKEKYTISLS